MTSIKIVETDVAQFANLNLGINGTISLKLSFQFVEMGLLLLKKNVRLPNLILLQLNIVILHARLSKLMVKKSNAIGKLDLSFKHASNQMDLHFVEMVRYSLGKTVMMATIMSETDVTTIVRLT